MRNGKIAKLPYLVRNELNERMEKEEAGSTLLTWLNAEPEVRKVLAEKFGGKEVSKQNLSDWRRGGFREWQLQREFKEAGTGMDPIRWDVDLPDLAENYLARMMGYYAVLMTGWDGKPDPEREARARVLRSLLRDGFLMQKWVIQMDKLKDELRERRRQRESIWDKGGGSLKEILAMAAALRAQNNRVSKDFDELSRAADEEAGVNAKTHPPTPRLRRTGRREDAKNDELPEGNATEQNSIEEEGSPVAAEESGLVGVGQGESCLAAGLDGRTEAGMNDELPQKNTKEHEKSSGVESAAGSEGSGVVVVGQGESCPAVELDGRTEAGMNDELPQKNTKEHEKSSGVESAAGSKGSGLVVVGQGESCLAVGLDGGTPDARPVEAVEEAEETDPPLRRRYRAGTRTEGESLAAKKRKNRKRRGN